MESLNPYESPRGEITPQGITWREKFASLARQSRVSWGATACFWALAAYLCFNIGVSLMMNFVSSDTKYGFYYPLRYYGTIGAVVLHAVGLLLLCYIGERIRAKTFFKLSLGCFLAYEAWVWMPYFETLEQRDAAPIPPSVQFAAQLTWILSPLFLFLALRRVSLYCRDRQMMRWSYVAFVIYTLMALVNITILALLYFKPEVEWQAISYKKFNLIELIYYTLLLLGLPVAYCYGRLLRRVAVLWEQPLTVEEGVTSVTPGSGTVHEPESV